ncbi:MAG TPA: hypothetical protein VLM37_03390 [Fibrobacteraceae bacterium]|nr:hypothetical protein [Fibrobacteraceae bacterium]
MRIHRLQKDAYYRDESAYDDSLFQTGVDFIIVAEGFCVCGLARSSIALDYRDCAMAFKSKRDFYVGRVSCIDSMIGLESASDSSNACLDSSSYSVQDLAPDYYNVVSSDSGQWYFLVFGYQSGYNRVDLFATDSTLDHSGVDFSALLDAYSESPSEA